MIKVCEICGNEGDLKRLLRCANCKSSVQHSYCMDKLPKDYELFTWKCEECDPKFDSVPSRRSARITLASEVKRNRMKKLMETSSPIKMQKQSSILKEDRQDHPNRTRQDKCSETHANLQQNECHQVDESKGRTLVTDKDSSSDEIIEYPSKEIFDDESLPLQPETVSSTLAPGDGMTCQLQYTNYNHVKPLSPPIWRGELRIINVIYFGVTAHLSSRASPRVRFTAASFKPSLRLELFSKSEIWPRSFQISPPTDDSIGLYFFPEYGRDEKDCQFVLNHMMEKKLAIKGSVNDVELLIFSSCELPSDHWRICGRYYLWGVFRQKFLSIP